MVCKFLFSFVLEKGKGQRFENLTYQTFQEKSLILDVGRKKTELSKLSTPNSQSRWAGYPARKDMQTIFFPK